MPERTHEVRTLSVDYICDKCGDGKMESTGIMLASNPPQWPHKCHLCGDVVNLRQSYPAIRYSHYPVDR